MRKTSRKNRQSGITLIALIVTIIVLIILAGVAISMLSDNNGVLNSASEARVASIIGEYKERVAMAQMALKTEITARMVSESVFIATDSSKFPDLAEKVAKEFGISKDDLIIIENTSGAKIEEGTRVATIGDTNIEGIRIATKTKEQAEINREGYTVAYSIDTKGDNGAEGEAYIIIWYTSNSLRSSIDMSTAAKQYALEEIETDVSKNEVVLVSAIKVGNYSSSLSNIGITSVSGAENDVKTATAFSKTSLNGTETKHGLGFTSSGIGTASNPSTPEEPETPTEITLASNGETSVSIEVESSEVLRVNVTPSETAVSWNISSGSDKVSLGSTSGTSVTVTGLSAGSATVVASAGGKTVTFNITVTRKSGWQGGSALSSVIGQIKVGQYVEYTFDEITSATATANSTEYAYSNRVGSYILDGIYTGTGTYSKPANNTPNFENVLTTPQSQNVAQTPNASIRWRVLNVDTTNNKIDLISCPAENGNIATNSQVTLKGPYGYNNGVYALNLACEKLYSNSSYKNHGVTVRSLNYEDDIETNLKSGVTSASMGGTVDGTAYGNTKTYASGQSGYYPSILNSGMALNVNTTKYTTGTGYTGGGFTAKQSYIAQSYTQMANNMRPKATGETESIYNLIFTNSVNSNSKNTWLASRGVYCSSSYAAFGFCGVICDGSLDRVSGCVFYSYSNINNIADYYLRPVVSLSSTVSLVKNTAQDGTVTWTIPEYVE